MTKEPLRTDEAGHDDALLLASIARQIGLSGEDLQVGLEIAKRHMQRDAFADALKVYIALVLCSPNDVDMQIGLANCTLHLGEFHIALQAASVAVALAPRDPRGYYLSGRACLGLGLVGEAEQDLRDAVTYGQEARDPVVVDEARRVLNALPSSADARSRDRAPA